MKTAEETLSGLISFKNDSGQYVTSTICYVGSVPVCYYCFNGLRSKGDSLCYKVISKQQTIKTELGNYETAEECKNRCVEVATVFIKQLLSEKK